MQAKGWEQGQPLGWRPAGAILLVPGRVELFLLPVGLSSAPRGQSTASLVAITEFQWKQHSLFHTYLLPYLLLG